MKHLRLPLLLLIVVVLLLPAPAPVAAASYDFRWYNGSASCDDLLSSQVYGFGFAFSGIPAGATFAADVSIGSSVNGSTSGSISGTNSAFFFPVTLNVTTPVSMPWTMSLTATLSVGGEAVTTAIGQVTCVGNVFTETHLSTTNASGGFSGPPLPGPEGRNLVLINKTTGVLDAPAGKQTGEVLTVCQTVFILQTSTDGKYGRIYVMGGWIPLSATVDIAEDYGQPGGQPVRADCVGH